MKLTKGDSIWVYSFCVISLVGGVLFLKDWEKNGDTFSAFIGFASIAMAIYNTAAAYQNRKNQK
jgi:uncharacterized membrane protein HdeD (DUF308 family)